jgi:YHS domain-containing protein
MPHRASFSLSRRFALSLGAAALFFDTAAIAVEPVINTLKNSLLGGRTDTAINGYDTVAYFTVGKPVKGLDSFVYEWNGAKWKFSSQDNLDLFKGSPEKYAPQYGGYCAYGVAQGSLVKVEPDQFTVRDGKLYLNYDAGVQSKWLKDIPGYNKAADAKFPSLLK